MGFGAGAAAAADSSSSSTGDGSADSCSSDGSLGSWVGWKSESGSAAALSSDVAGRMSPRPSSSPMSIASVCSPASSPITPAPICCCPSPCSSISSSISSSKSSPA